jgi:hypothetical protein
MQKMVDAEDGRCRRW